MQQTREKKKGDTAAASSSSSKESTTTEKEEKKQTEVTLSGLLNAIDGLAAPEVPLSFRLLSRIRFSSRYSGPLGYLHNKLQGEIGSCVEVITLAC